MSPGDEIVHYLETKDVGTLGTDLFLGPVPDKAAAITVIETGGPAPYHDYGSGAIDYPSVQILVRNPSYTLARDKADQIRDALDGLANSAIGGGRYLSVMAMGDPAYLGKTATSQGETHEFSLNFATMRKRT